MWGRHVTCQPSLLILSVVETAPYTAKMSLSLLCAERNPLFESNGIFKFKQRNQSFFIEYFPTYFLSFFIISLVNCLTSMLMSRSTCRDFHDRITSALMQRCTRSRASSVAFWLGPCSHGHLQILWIFWWYYVPLMMQQSKVLAVFVKAFTCRYLHLNRSWNQWHIHSAIYKLFVMHRN